MNADEVTRQRAEELLRFLPTFSDPRRAFVKRWSGPETKGGISSFPFPEYEQDVLDFFKFAAQEWWSDHSYNPELVGRMIQDDKKITAANLPEIKSMLTFAVRGERFCDGHWATLLQAGRIQKLLMRLEQLVPALPTHRM